MNEERNKTKADIKKFSKEIEKLEAVWGNDYENWTGLQKDMYGNHQQLRE